MSEKNNDNSVKKDILLAGGSIVAFYVVLVLAQFADTFLGLTEAYTLVDVASVGLKVATASAFAWLIKRLVFSNTLGKDFGTTFNEGWATLPKKEKTRWILGAFLVLFTAIVLS